jgi:hypothetical protein
MPALDEVMNHSAESANQANVRGIDGKRFSPTNGVGGPSLAALTKPSQAPSYEDDLSPLDTEQWEAENRLGCVHGVLWSLIFEAALAAGAVLYWKYHFFSH